MRTSEIKEFSTADLKEKIDELEDLYLKMKRDNAVSDIENPIRIRYTRRDIARLKTELTARNSAEK